MTLAPLVAITLDCPDPAALATFYAGVVGGEIVHHGVEFVALVGPPAGPRAPSSPPTTDRSDHSTPPPPLAPDLHAGFARPSTSSVDDRVRFLRAVDELPGLRPVRTAMRRCSVPGPGTVVDVGCGLGLETARLAADHPATTVIGLDRDPGILAAARDHAPALDNLRWRVGDAAALDLAPASVDLVRTERALMYVGSLDDAAASIRSVLRPGGLYTGFELDYGATVLPPVGLAPEHLRTLAAEMEGALPQPWAGRLLPEALSGAGMTVTAVEPFAFTVDAAVWSRIVADTLRGSCRASGSLEAAHVEAWLHDVDRHAFHAVFTGICTTARRP